jgi:hypothetical protein
MLQQEMVQFSWLSNIILGATIIMPHLQYNQPSAMLNQDIWKLF